jgi:hypothetical protein
MDKRVKCELEDNIINSFYQNEQSTKSVLIKVWSSGWKRETWAWGSLVGSHRVLP